MMTGLLLPCFRGYDDDNGDDDADNVDDEIESYFSNNNDYRHEDYSSEEPKGRVRLFDLFSDYIVLIVEALFSP